MEKQKQDEDKAFEEWCRVQREQHCALMERVSAEKERLLRMSVEKDEFAAMVMARRQKIYQAEREWHPAERERHKAHAEREKTKFQRDEEARIAADRQKRQEEALTLAAPATTTTTTTTTRVKPVRRSGFWGGVLLFLFCFFL